MNPHSKVIAAALIGLVLLAGCRQAEPPLPPAATPVRVTVVVTSVPTATPAPTDTPGSGAGTPDVFIPPPGGGSGGLIAFVSTRDGNGEIYVMDASGGNPRQLTNNQVWDGYPSWSPDGKQIVFNSRRDGHKLEIDGFQKTRYVMDVEGAVRGAPNVRRLTNNPADDLNGVWQPRPTN